MKIVDMAEVPVSEADRRVADVMQKLSDTNFGSNLKEIYEVQFELSKIGVLWSTAANITKDLSEPLKSIVNK